MHREGVPALPNSCAAGQTLCSSSAGREDAGAPSNAPVQAGEGRDSQTTGVWQEKGQQGRFLGADGTAQGGMSPVEASEQQREGQQHLKCHFP